MRPYGEAEPCITHDLLVADMETRTGLVKNNFCITVIYGWHLSEEQAYEVVDCIDDNSIVFVEGHMRDRQYANMRLAQHTALAEARLSHGMYDLESTESREALATEFLIREHSIPTEHDLHSYSLYIGLLDKGCVVLPADYLNLDEHTPELASSEALREELRSFFPIESDEVLEQVTELNAGLLTKWLHNQVVREQAAFNLVLYFLSHYSGTQGLESLAATSDGKTKAYVIFGLAHRDSLTAHFEESDIPIERLFVNSGDTPVEKLRNIALEIAQTPDERRTMIRRYYLGLLATQQEASC